MERGLRRPGVETPGNERTPSGRRVSHRAPVKRIRPPPLRFAKEWGTRSLHPFDRAFSLSRSHRRAKEIRLRLGEGGPRSAGRESSPGCSPALHVGPRSFGATFRPPAQDPHNAKHPSRGWVIGPGDAISGEVTQSIHRRRAICKLSDRLTASIDGLCQMGRKALRFLDSDKTAERPAGCTPSRSVIEYYQADVATTV